MKKLAIFALIGYALFYSLVDLKNYIGGPGSADKAGDSAAPVHEANEGEGVPDRGLQAGAPTPIVAEERCERRSGIPGITCEEDRLMTWLKDVGPAARREVFRECVIGDRISRLARIENMTYAEVERSVKKYEEAGGTGGIAGAVAESEAQRQALQRQLCSDRVAAKTLLQLVHETRCQSSSRAHANHRRLKVLMEQNHQLYYEMSQW